MGDIFGVNSAAKRQAETARQNAERQAQQDRLSAQAANQSREAVIAQDKATMAASELLAKPVDQVDVQVGEATPAAEIDPNTGRRRTTRSSFQVNRKTSGLSL